MLFEYLREHYEGGEPIFLDDIHIEGMSRPNFRQQIKTLADNGKIVRYEKGIYYIPKAARYRFSTGPSPETVADRKYVARRGKVSGYYSGGTFANLIGISLQVPAKIEIVTNNIAAIVREVSVGKQRFIVRRSNVPVTNENAGILRLLELLKNLDSYLDCGYAEAREKIKAYSLANKITKRDIDRYIRAFPDSTFRFYYEMRLDDVLAP